MTTQATKLAVPGSLLALGNILRFLMKSPPSAFGLLVISVLIVVSAPGYLPGTVTIRRAGRVQGL